MIKIVAGLSVMVFSAMPVVAQDQSDTVTTEPSLAESPASKLPLWEAGLFASGITQPAYPGAYESANLLFGVPFVIYRGEYLRIDRGTVGVRAIKTPRAEIDVSFSASLGSRADVIEARRGMDDLGTLLEFGPRLRINIGDAVAGERRSRIQIPVRSVFDVNDHFRYRGIAYELQWVTDMTLAADWDVTTSLGAVFGDQQLADTFYRVAPAEATATRPAYNASSGLIALRATIFASRLFKPEMRWGGYLRFDSLAGAANQDSPLVRRDTGWTLGLGLAWTLAQSEREARD